MQFRKQVIGHLEKCYSLSQLRYRGRNCLLVAAEKHAPCCLFEEDGRFIDIVWNAPGGVMTMTPVPGREGAFLATQRFYSPNDCLNSCLVYTEDTETGWEVEEIASLPGVHRFGILPRDGKYYIIACTLKSNYEYKNDWRFPGKILVGELPEDPRQLRLTVWREGLLRNHGFTLVQRDGYTSAVVSCEEGVFRIDPPSSKGNEWSSTTLLEYPASDAVCADLDGDGLDEIMVFSPFHGSELSIWRQRDGVYVPEYRHAEQLPFLHAIDTGVFYGQPVVLAGNREGRRELLAFYFDPDKKEYAFRMIDEGCGPTNCMIFQRDGHPSILAANRETNEIAIYDVLP